MDLAEAFSLLEARFEVEDFLLLRRALPLPGLALLGELPTTVLLARLAAAAADALEGEVTRSRLLFAAGLVLIADLGQFQFQGSNL
mgnify:CR=1 FL=1